MLVYMTLIGGFNMKINVFKAISDKINELEMNTNDKLFFFEFIQNYIKNEDRSDYDTRLSLKSVRHISDEMDFTMNLWDDCTFNLINKESIINVFYDEFDDTLIIEHRNMKNEEIIYYYLKDGKGALYYYDKHVFRLDLDESYIIQESLEKAGIVPDTTYYFNSNTSYDDIKKLIPLIRNNKSKITTIYTDGSKVKTL